MICLLVSQLPWNQLRVTIHTYISNTIGIHNQHDWYTYHVDYVCVDRDAEPRMLHYSGAFGHKIAIYSIHWSKRMGSYIIQESLDILIYWRPYRQHRKNICPWTRYSKFILTTVKLRVATMARLREVLWIIWHKEVVGTSPSSLIVLTCSSSFVDQLCSSWADSSSPACVYHPTTQSDGAWGTRWTRVFLSALLSSISSRTSLSFWSRWA